MSLTSRLFCGILCYLSSINPSEAIYNCRTPDVIQEIAEERGYTLIDEANNRLIFDLHDGRKVYVYFKALRKDRPELLCMYHEEVIHEVGGL